jgi:hypothetical protein
MHSLILNFSFVKFLTDRFMNDCVLKSLSSRKLFINKTFENMLNNIQKILISLFSQSEACFKLNQLFTE